MAAPSAPFLFFNNDDKAPHCYTVSVLCHLSFFLFWWGRCVVLKAALQAAFRTWVSVCVCAEGGFSNATCLLDASLTSCWH